MRITDYIDEYSKKIFMGGEIIVCKIFIRPLPLFWIIGTLKPDASRYGKARCVLFLSGFRI